MCGCGYGVPEEVVVLCVVAVCMIPDIGSGTMCGCGDGVPEEVVVLCVVVATVYQKR
jgi:hypothetical protein